MFARNYVVIWQKPCHKMKKVYIFMLGYVNVLECGWELNKLLIDTGYCVMHH